MRRRTFVRTTAVALGTVAMGAALTACTTDGGGSTTTDPSDEGTDTGAEEETVGTMPDEGRPHARTWMAFGPSEEIWGADLVPEVQRNLASIAATIARFEPVSMLVRTEDLAAARELLGENPDVELVEAEIDDLWMRDTGPVFVEGPDGLVGVDLNFNGWGEKQEHARDATVAARVCELAGVERARTELVMEGGGIEVDGEGTAIVTESCVLNDNRNPGWTKGDVEAELGRLLGIEKVVWLPGIRGKDITDGHTDFYARFAEPGVVVAGRDDDPDSFDHAVTRRHLKILEGAMDARGRELQVEVLVGPSEVREEWASDDFAAGYINFYVCDGGVIAPGFGDAEADAAAKETLERLFPDREVVQIDIDGIAAGGGGIHCATQQQPAG